MLSDSANLIKTNFRSLHIFSSIATYWQVLEKAHPKCVPLKFFSNFKTSQLTTILRAMVMAFKTNKNYYYRCKIWQNMLVHGLFNHGKQHFFHKRKSIRKFEHKGIGVKLTCKAKHFHNWTRACNPYKYNTPNLLKITIVVHHFFVGFWGTKKINNCIAKWTYPFLPQLRSMNNKFYHLFIEFLFPFIK